MLRSQKAVDKHVQEIFRKISNEKERNLRCYNVAKLYHRVGDFQSARRYTELYLRENPKVAGAHKLLGQALEGLKEYAKALEEYKCSLSLESKQPDLILKVCELLVETKTKLAVGEAKYWMERAEEVANNHQTVFRLKEHLIKMEDGSGDQAQLIQLAEKEIEARPLDHTPRIRLLRLQLDTKRIQDAFKYTIDLEARCLFRDSIQWYACVVDVFKAYQQEKNLDSDFYLNHLCVLERYAALCSREQLASHSQFSTALYGLDQALFEACKFLKREEDQLLVECIKHVSRQLSFHLGTALLRLCKQSRSDCKDWISVVWAFMSLAYSTPESADFISDSSTPSGKERQKRLLKIWREDSAFRSSQAGHILLSMPRERNYSIQLSGGNWRGKIFKLLFAVQIHGKQNFEKSSFLMTDACFADIQESVPSVRDLALHDDLSQHQRPDSLHTLVWLGLRYLEPAAKQVLSVGSSYIPPHRLSPNFSCHIFEELKLSSNSLETGGVETLSRLDVDTFLYASVFCAAAALDERHTNALSHDTITSLLPVDLTEALCTDAQSKWWSSTYCLHTNKSRSDIGDVRMLVTRGLEIVRVLGNHGMDVRLVVLLAKLFSEKASSLSTPKDSKPAISKRALLLWNCAINLLERINKSQPVRMPENSLFRYVGKDLTRSEVKMLLDEGRFFIACRLMDEKKYEKALEVFQDLKNPYASFYEGLIYKKLADAELEYQGGENLTSENKSRYVIFLQKSRSALHLTLDRLRSPQNAGKHPLNSELEQHLEEVENCLAREESDLILSSVNQNTYDGLLDDSFSSRRFEDSLASVSRIVNTSVHHHLISNLGLSNHGSTSTPFKTKRSIDSTVNLNASSSERVEARPSPERLDAQLRRLTVKIDGVIQVLDEQNRQMLDSNKTMMDALDNTRVAVQELQSQMANMRHEVARLKISDGRLQTGKGGDYLSVLHPEEEYDYNVAASQLRSLQAFPTGAPYGSYPGQAFNYDSRAPATTVPIQPMLPQALYPQNQVPLARNVDPNGLLLSSYYSQATLGLNFNDRHAASNGSLASPVHGGLPGTVLLQGPAIGSSVQNAESGVAVDPYKKVLPMIGTPILSHSSLSTPIIDLSSASLVSSASKGQQLPVQTSTVGLTNQVPQNFSVPSHQGSSILAPQSKFAANPVSAESAPHNFQISMPPQATIPTTESLEKSLSPLKPISMETMLPNVPMPAYSAVSVKQGDSKSNRQSTGSAGGNETFTEDADYNPCADFKPIIPLPEEIVVTTGEEDETPLFVRRAKLFRFINGEWKERGVGDIKILKHNITGKPRILMRREQIFKICANHFILPEMELAPQTGSDRAWSWGANDFSDGEPHVEKLCVRFKTVDDAQKFKETFDDARKLAKVASSPKVSSSTTSVVKSECESSSQISPSSSGKVEFGGFSFISPPVLKPVERQAKTTPGKDKESTSTVSKPSPFAGFSFTPTPSSTFGSPSWPAAASSSGSQSTPTSTTVVSEPVFGSVSSSPSSTSLFASKPYVTTTTTSLPSKDNPIFSNSSNLLDFAALAAKNQSLGTGKKDNSFKGFEGAGAKVFGGITTTTASSPASKNTGEQESVDAEEFEPTAVFSPIIPLPSLVEVRTGEEDEDVIFEERAKLLRFDSKEWKERGIGKMKVLKNRITRKVRLLMRREQVLKVCCNHLVTPDMEFVPLKTSDKAITWSAQDFSEGEVSTEVFALRFKTPELMHAFKDVIENVQKELREAPPASSPSASKELPKQDARPLSQLFKPKEGSWECSGCFTRNEADKTSCPCCSQPKPGCEGVISEKKPQSTSKFSFGIQPSLNQLSSSVKSGTGITFGNIATSKENQPSLSEMFKSKEGSWVCQSCYTRAEPDQVVCKACETPKPGHDARSKENKPSLSEMFKPKEGSWVCQACYTRGEPDQVVCKACETPKPGHEKETKTPKSNFGNGVGNTPTATFSFGMTSTSLGQSSEAKPFSFGTSAQQAESKSTFSFGIPSSGTADSSKSFSFGSIALGGSSTVTPSSGFSFAAANQGQAPSFGSPHKFEFQMRPSSPSKSPAKSPCAPSGGEESEEEVEEENEDVGDFKPVVPLPDKVPVLTGEEDESVLYCHRAKLYRFADGEWKERGLGDMKVLRHNVTNKARLLMRREQVLKICLNHYISSDLDLKPKDNRTWMWCAQDFSEGVVVPEKFACRFKSADIALDFKKAVDDAKAEVVPSPSVREADSISSASSTANDDSSAKVVTPTMQNFSFKLPSSDKPGVVRSLFGSSAASSSTTDEVEIVYEATVSQEERDAALKLKLPENFYLYKQAPPCAGCPGCEKDSDSDQGDNQSSVVLKEKTFSTSGTFNASAAVFGSGSSLFSSSSFSAPSSTMIFGGTTNSKQSNTGTGLAGLFGTGTLASGFGSTAVNSHSTAFPILGKFAPPAPKEEKTKQGEDKEKSDSVPFLPVSNSPSFASLAAGASSNPIFGSMDSTKSFVFAGAGSKVFGVASSESPASKGSNKDEDGDSEGETAEAADETDNHDPHFEPIIAMPDMVEVRTGEEEEEKLFCQRAKLYRYDPNTKEWKERGVGEMKILKHPLNGTYRLLLRREQVHKVVLNQRVDAELRLKPMTSSDRAWCWGGLNYAECPEGEVEELAIRFKHPELANEFLSTLNECQKCLLSGIGAENPHIEEAEDDEEYEDEEDGAFEIVFEKHVSLTAEPEDSSRSKATGSGDLRVVQHSDGSYYVEMEDESRILCRAPILGDAEVQRKGNICIWRSLDNADLDDEAGVEKKFTVTFESESDADEFQDLYSNITLQVVEQTYDYVDEAGHEAEHEA